MSAPDKIWAWPERPIYCAAVKPSNREPLTEYTRTAAIPLPKPWDESWRGGVKQTLQILIMKLGLINDMEDINIAQYDETLDVDLDALVGEILERQSKQCPEDDLRVKALVEAAQEAWDQACANHDRPPPTKYMAPYGGLVKLHAALAAMKGGA